VERDQHFGGRQAGLLQNLGKLFTELVRPHLRKKKSYINFDKTKNFTVPEMLLSMSNDYERV
jgi:hypothetical protein